MLGPNELGFASQQLRANGVMLQLVISRTRTSPSKVS
jgi:hypothetical protein